MKKIILSFFFTLTLLGIQITISGQPVVNFTLPDTSCVGTQINITNQTTGGTTFYWNFCSGNANITPVGTNIGNPGNSLLEPTYITLVQDSTDCFSFTSDQGNPTHITRYYHGSSFRNNPISWTNLVTGTTSWEVEGIQIKKDNGKIIIRPFTGLILDHHYGILVLLLQTLELQRQFLWHMDLLS